MDRLIEQALQASTNYSEEFTAEVGRLAERVRSVLGPSVEHGTDMNYSSSQRIVCGIDVAGEPVRSEASAAYAMAIAYVSSRAKLFTVLVFEAAATKGAAKQWSSPTEGGEHAGVVRVIGAMSSILEAAGYRRLSGPVLRELAPGQETEMDGVPATVFDVIFSEVV